MGLKHLEDVTYFRLNNEINRPVNGQIMLHKDKEALDAFFKENVVPNTMVLIQSLIKSTTSLNTTTWKQPLSRNTVQSSWKNCHQFIKEQNFQFKSFMAAYKFTINMP